MKRILVITLALLLTAGIALAQGRGNGGGGMMGNPPAGMGPGAPGMGGVGMGGPGGGILVASDGTVLLPSVVTNSATNTSTAQITAVSAAGAKLWTASITNRGHLTLSGTQLLTVSQSSTDSAISSTVNALSLATGASLWSLTLNGAVHSLTPFSGGTYAVVVTPATTAGGTPTRSLVAISTAGSIVWKLDV